VKMNTHSLHSKEWNQGNSGSAVDGHTGFAQDQTEMKSQNKLVHASAHRASAMSTA
jgi:hypothetical protein